MPLLLSPVDSFASLVKTKRAIGMDGLALRKFTLAPIIDNRRAWHEVQQLQRGDLRRNRFQRGEVKAVHVVIVNESRARKPARETHPVVFKVACQVAQSPVPSGKGFSQRLAGEEVKRAVHPPRKRNLLIRRRDNFAKGPAIRVYCLAGLHEIQPEISRRSVSIIQAISVRPKAQPIPRYFQQVSPGGAAGFQVEARHPRHVVKTLILWEGFPFEPRLRALIPSQRGLKTFVSIGTVVGNKIQQNPQPFRVCQIQ